MNWLGWSGGELGEAILFLFIWILRIKSADKQKSRKHQVESQQYKAELLMTINSSLLSESDGLKKNVCVFIHTVFKMKILLVLFHSIHKSGNLKSRLCVGFETESGIKYRSNVFVIDHIVFYIYMYMHLYYSKPLLTETLHPFFYY